MAFFKGNFRGSQHCYFPLYLIAFLQQQRPGSQLSGAKNRIDLSQLEQFLSFFIFQNPFFDSKILRTVMRTVKKIKKFSLLTRKREEISQKFQRIWIQQAKSILSE
jgi:hypothetical protein